MNQKNNLTAQDIFTSSLYVRMLIGGMIALAVISFFVFGIDEPPAEWGNLWRTKPLILTPVAGAMGGAFTYFMSLMAHRGVNKTVTFLMSVIGFIIALWLGTVLGLNGTMWD